jgi:hypothetical protein
MCSNCDLFSKHGQLFFGLWLLSKEFQHPPHSNQNRAALWWIYSSHKSAPANRKTGFFANRDPGSEQAGGWIHFCMKRLRTLKSFQIFKSEIKKS